MGSKLSTKKFIRKICLEMGDEDFEKEQIVTEVMAAFGVLTSNERDPHCIFANHALEVLAVLAEPGLVRG